MPKQHIHNLMLVLNAWKNDGFSMQQQAWFGSLSCRQHFSLVLLATEEKNRHDPSVREWVSQVIKADKTDHLGLIRHSLPIDGRELSHSICGFITNIPWFVASPTWRLWRCPEEKKCNRSDVLIVCTDYTVSKVRLRLNPYLAFPKSRFWNCLAYCSFPVKITCLLVLMFFN